MEARETEKQQLETVLEQRLREMGISREDLEGGKPGSEVRSTILIKLFATISLSAITCVNIENVIRAHYFLLQSDSQLAKTEPANKADGKKVAMLISNWRLVYCINSCRQRIVRWCHSVLQLPAKGVPIITTGSPNSCEYGDPGMPIFRGCVNFYDTGYRRSGCRRGRQESICGRRGPTPDSIIGRQVFRTPVCKRTRHLDFPPKLRSNSIFKPQPAGTGCARLWRRSCKSS